MRNIDFTLKSWNLKHNRCWEVLCLPMQFAINCALGTPNVANNIPDKFWRSKGFLFSDWLHMTKAEESISQNAVLTTASIRKRDSSSVWTMLYILMTLLKVINNRLTNKLV